MKRFAFILFGWLLATMSMNAQSDETLFNKTGLRLTGGWGGYGVGISEVADENVGFRGGFGGIELNKSIFLGWGGLELEGDINLENDRVSSIDYNGFIAGYAHKAHKVFHPQFMVMVGNGNVEVEREDRDRIFVVQPMAGVEVNVFQWFRIGINGGYRIVSGTDVTALSDNDLTAPYGEVKFKFGWSWGD